MSRAAGIEDQPLEGPVPPRVDEADYARLAKALCSVTCVTSPEYHELLLGKLPRVRSGINRNAVPVVFTDALVGRCRESRLLGVLMRWIGYWSDDSRSWRTAALIAEPLVREEEWAQVSQAIPEATRQQVDTVREELVLYDAADFREIADRVRGARPIDRTPSDRAWHTFVALAEIPGREGESALVEFCAILGARGALRCAALLEGWGGGSAPEAPGAPPGPDAGEDVPARLVVHVERGEERDRHDLRYWTVLREHGGDRPDFCDSGTRKGVTPDRIADSVGVLLGLVEVDHRREHHRGRMRVELVAELDLLRELEADRWQEAGGAAGAPPLGARAEVVYRAAELEDPSRRDYDAGRRALGRRWAALLRCGSGVHLDTAHEAQTKERLSGRTYREPLEDRLPDDRIAILSVPSHLDDCHQSVRSAIRFGVPVVVWRSADNGRGIGPWLNLGKTGREVTVSSEKLQSIPQVLHKSRSGGVSPDDSGYIEESFEVAVFYHDSLPVLPDPPPLTASSIRTTPR
ncbi:hypothetical protein [Nocardiopsis tropica]|uniref:Uncharacterized protein n=1 Tax=Nocardiopsis tropica TaxID=109330 RepID=A0ABU7KVS7_9ACTN|nr:hypothetical protein [Nocardiopsis umidischolae]MEE2053403.1 hypothetical protein [Nocardiopsis umidischolae]